MKTKLTFLTLLLLLSSITNATEPCTSIRFQFDSSYVDLPNSTIYMNSGGAFTWEFWFQIDDSLPTTGNGFYQMMFSIDANNPTIGNDAFIGFGDQSVPKNSLVFRVNNRSVNIPASSHNIVPNNWYFVAGVCNPYTGLTLYLFRGNCDSLIYIASARDSSLVSTISLACMPRLGKWGISANPRSVTHSQFKGKLDEIRIWSQALSYDDISRRAKTCIYDPNSGGTFTPPTNLAAYYPVLNIDRTPGTNLQDMVASLNGIISFCTFEWNPPTDKSAPLECCCSERGCPDINFNSVGNCCYNFSFVHGTPPWSSGSTLTSVVLNIISPPGNSVVFSSVGTSGSVAVSPHNWFGTINNPLQVTYTGPLGFSVGELVQTLSFCVNNPQGKTFVIEWKTYKGLDSLCWGYDTIRCCIDSQPCTSIHIGSDSSSAQSYVDLPTSNVYLNNGGSFTWELWFKLDNPLPTTGTGFEQMLISIDQNNPTPTNDAYIGFGDQTLLKSDLVFRVNELRCNIPMSTHSIVSNQWYFVAGTCDMSGSGNKRLDLYLYTMVSGTLTLVASTNRVGSLTPITGNTMPRIGRWGISPNTNAFSHSQFKGNIDELRFWSIVKTQAQIEMDARKCFWFTPCTAFTPPPSLSAYYPVLFSDRFPGILLTDLIGGLNGFVQRCFFVSQMPLVNAAPLVCCYNEPTISPCDSLRIFVRRIDPSPNYPCSYNIIITSPINIPAITRVVFSTVPPTVVFTGGVGPTGWGPPLSPWGGNVQGWNCPGSIFPAGTHSFTLNFNSGAVPSFDVIISYVDVDSNNKCSDTITLACGDCCSRFSSININSRLFQIGNSVLVLGNMTALPGPIIRASATLVYAYQSPTTSSGGHIYSDFISAKGNTPTWMPPLPSSPLCGIPGIMLNSYTSRYPYSREVIWGSYSNFTSANILASCPYAIRILFTPVLPIGDEIKFGIRYAFTDTSCCTCDTLVDYYIHRRPNFSPFKETKIGKGNDKILFNEVNEDNNRFSEITMTSATEGTLSIANLSTNDMEYPYVITQIALEPDTNVNITMLKDKKSGKTANIINGKAYMNVIINPEEIAQFELTYDNPSDYLIIPNNITIAIVFKDFTLDTIPISEKVIARAPNAGGDLVEKDNDADLNNIFTFGLSVKNANAGKESISKIELQPKENDKILAVGSDAINNLALLGIYNFNDKLVAMPEPVWNSEVSALEQDETIKPIYITVRTNGENRLALLFKTYNADGDIISKGEVNIPTGIIEEQGGTLGLIYNCSTYPNPAKSYVTFLFNNDIDLENVSLTIYNINGIEVANILKNNIVPAGKNAVLFDISNLVSGTYYWTIRSKDFQKTSVITIVR